jgi:hypothetical protein
MKETTSDQQRLSTWKASMIAPAVDSPYVDACDVHRRWREPRVAWQQASGPPAIAGRGVAGPQGQAVCSSLSGCDLHVTKTIMANRSRCRRAGRSRTRSGLCQVRSHELSDRTGRRTSGDVIQISVHGSVPAQRAPRRTSIELVF